MRSSILLGVGEFSHQSYKAFPFFFFVGVFIWRRPTRNGSCFFLLPRGYLSLQGPVLPVLPACPDPPIYFLFLETPPLSPRPQFPFSSLYETREEAGDRRIRSKHNQWVKAPRTIKKEKKTTNTLSLLLVFAALLCDSLCFSRRQKRLPSNVCLLRFSNDRATRPGHQRRPRWKSYQTGQGETGAGA